VSRRAPARPPFDLSEHPIPLLVPRQRVGLLGFGPPVAAASVLALAGRALAK